MNITTTTCARIDPTLTPLHYRPRALGRRTLRALQRGGGSAVLHGAVAQQGRLPQ